MTQPPNHPGAGRPEIASVMDENAALKAEVAALKDLVTVLLAKIAELERRLGLGSSG